MATKDPDFESALSEAYRLSRAGSYGPALEAARLALARARAVGSVGLEVRAARMEASMLSLSSRKQEALERLAWVLDVTSSERGTADLHTAAELAELRVMGAIVASYVDWVEITGWVGSADAQQRLVALDRAEALVEAVGRPGWRAGIFSMRSSIMRSLSRWDEAVKLGEAAVRCYEPGAPGSSLASYRQQYADVLLGAGRLESAEVQYMAILMEKGRAVRDEKSALVGLARCALRRGDFEEAKRRAEEALVIAEPLGDGAVCGALDILIQALRAAGELEHAAAVADRLIERARRTNNATRLFFAIRSQIDLSLERADEEMARLWLDEAAVLATSLDHASGGEQHLAQVRTRRARLAPGRRP